METSDLNRFETDQLRLAAALLRAYAGQGAEWLGEGVRLCVNGRQEAPYLIDDDDHVAMMGGRGHLRQLFHCQGCGLEGFDGDLHRFDGRLRHLRFRRSGGYCTARCRREHEPVSDLLQQ